MKVRTKSEALTAFALQEASFGTSRYKRADHAAYIDGLADRIARASAKTGHAADIPTA